ncbi:MAG: TlpA family protein disulfide reductase [Campylobacteraceae bacterium]|jgi:thiol-disulfide isomerase/thioredoxin|nr:TlpA family protein disulfide reductase [Campylobacteraceae bacterium]
MKYLIVIFCALLMFGCTDKEDIIPKSSALKVGESIELTSVHSAKIKIKRVEGGLIQEGKENAVLIIDIFGTFCEPCKKEAPALMNLQLKHISNMTLIGLSYFEDVDEKYIIENFAKPYNAYYFIAKNSPANKALADTVTEDIKYKSLISLPFKVVLKDGKYRNVTDIWENKTDNKYYIGAVDTAVIEKDLERILKE